MVLRSIAQPVSEQMIATDQIIMLGHLAPAHIVSARFSPLTSTPYARFEQNAPSN
jgi:hypothetical protein